MVEFYQLLKRLYVGAKTRSGSTRRRTLGPLLRYLENEAASVSEAPSLPLSERVHLWRHGFLSRETNIYDFDRYGQSQYLSDLQHERAAVINEPLSAALDNKLLFYWLMAPYDDHRQSVYGLIRDGAFHDVESSAPVGVERLAATNEAVVQSDGDGSTLHDAATWIRERLRGGEKLVLKPINGAMGRGVSVLEGDGGDVLVDGNETSSAALEERLSTADDVLVCEFVEQEAYADRVFPDATNSIRVLTMWDYDANRPFVPVAIHRFGSEHSAPTDNWSGGGFATSVDLDSGRLSSALQYRHDGTLVTRDRHPATETSFENVRIPGWQSIRSELLEMARDYSYLPYVGWDVVVTDNGEFSVIEANNCTGVKMLQAFEPLLSDPRVEQFYRHHGVL
jgi:hypothetical protein